MSKEIMKTIFNEPVYAGDFVYMPYNKSIYISCLRGLTKRGNIQEFLWFNVIDIEVSPSSVTYYRIFKSRTYTAMRDCVKITGPLLEKCKKALKCNQPEFYNKYYGDSNESTLNT